MAKSLRFSLNSCSLLSIYVICDTATSKVASKQQKYAKNDQFQIKLNNSDTRQPKGPLIQFVRRGFR